MIPNRRPRVVDAYDKSAKMRKAFQDRDVRQREKMSFSWPSTMQLIGKCESVIYTSNKWQTDGSFNDYKHIAEGPQKLMVAKGGIGDWTTDETIDVVGPWLHLPSVMPREFAKLAKFQGIQFRLYDSFSRGKGRLSRSPDDLMELRVDRGFLGGAFVPDEDDMEYPVGANLEPGSPFLFVYTLSDGVHCIITGSQLAVERDGIVG
jgi:hypothetical protein